MRKLILTLVSLVAAGTASAATVDRVAAVVDDEVIALSEVYELGEDFIQQRCGGQTDAACVREAELEVLDALIERTLIRQELGRLGLETTGQEVDRAIDTMVQQYGMADREQLKQQLAAQGLTWELYREQLTEQLRQMKFAENVLRPRTTVTENELRDLYQRTARDFEQPSQAELEAFAVAIPAEATDEERKALTEKTKVVVAELNAGKRDWAATVQELDQGGYAQRGGKMGSFRKGELHPTLDAAVFGLEPGKVGEPIDLGNALVVVKLVNMKSSGVRPYEEVEPQLREQLYSQKMEGELEEWYQQARRKAAIKILLEDPTS